MSQEEITKWHRFELMDRCHCVEHMFNELVSDHPATQVDEIKAIVESVQEKLHDLYQAAATQSFKDPE